MTGSDASPFRQTAWPLSWMRLLLHRLRLARIASGMAGEFRHGRHVAVARNADVRSPHFCRVGSFVSFGKNFTCETDLEIGNHVLISSNVSVIGKDHPFDDPELTVYTQPRVDVSVVTIGSDVLIGFGSIVIGTVSIGDGCIVGAGSVVTRDLPAYTVCVGNPARPIRARHAVRAGDIRERHP